MYARKEAEARIQGWTDRANAWNANRESVATSVKNTRAAKTIDEQAKLSASLSPDRELIRPLLVILPTLSTVPYEV